MLSCSNLFTFNIVNIKLMCKCKNVIKHYVKMFEILQEWLTTKLGITNCLNLNFGNVGEKFKDGVLFARVLQKYQVIPDSNINVIKKTNIYTACLNNIKNLKLWLRFLDITIEEYIVHDIACGQSLAATKLLYQLFFKLEMSKQYQLLECKKSEENKKLNSSAVDNLCNTKNSKHILLNQERRKHKENISKLDYETYNDLKIFYGLKGIQYTAIDIMKSTKNKNDVLNFIQHNMDCFYDLFIQILDEKLFKDETMKKPNAICKSMINTLNPKEYMVLNKQLNNNSSNLKINNNNKNSINTKSDNKHQIIQNYYESLDDLKNSNSTVKTLKTEEYTPHDLDDQDFTNVVKQDIFYEYLHHFGLWSIEYLNIDPYKCKQNILSMITKKVLNYEYGKSEIKSMDLEKSHFSGVIDLIQNTNVVKLIKDQLESKEILCFTAHEAVTACLNAYNEELKVSINKGKLYQTLDEYCAYQTAIKKRSNNQKFKKKSGSDEIGEYMFLKFQN